MDLTKKRSSKYVAGIYAFFIILFAFTLSLFYVSRSQKSSPPAEPDAGILEPQDFSENSQKITKKIVVDKGQSNGNFETPESKIENEGVRPALSKQNSSDDPKSSMDDLKRPEGETIIPAAKPIQSQPALKKGAQNMIIYFSAESTGLTDEALKKLKKIFLFLLKEPDEELIIEGYGDSSQTDSHNKNLSKLRANIVKGYFVKRGISNARIKTYWMGTEDLKGVDNFQEGRKKTHQVEVRFKLRSEDSLND
jgi:outer membrane protein OmpA-like peptidoglycan-associated protein